MLVRRWSIHTSCAAGAAATGSQGGKGAAAGFDTGTGGRRSERLLERSQCVRCPREAISNDSTIEGALAQAQRCCWLQSWHFKSSYDAWCTLIDVNSRANCARQAPVAMRSSVLNREAVNKMLV